MYSFSSKAVGGPKCNHYKITKIYEDISAGLGDLRNQISSLQNRLDNCNFEKKEIMNQLQKLEKEKFRKGSKTGLPREQKVGKENKNVETSCDKEIGENIAILNRELMELKGKHDNVLENNVVLQNQLINREEEIKRLQSLVEGGRPYKSASKDCCYQNIDGQLGLLQDEVTRLKREKSEIVVQMKDALAKQHEAMRRALHLAERNRQLEKEMREIDEIALAVEAKCNETVKENTEKVTRLQDRINESLVLIQNLEADNAKLKQAHLVLSTDYEAVKLEKAHLQNQFDMERDDKKRLTDRINNFTIIETDLNIEIDRLTKLTSEQRRKIVELESQVSQDKNRMSSIDVYRYGDMGQEETEMSEKTSQTMNKKKTSKQKLETTNTCKNICKNTCKRAGKRPSKSGSPSKMGSKDFVETVEPAQKCCCESGTCMKNLKDLLDKEMEYRQAQATQSLENIKQEKEYYMREYHKALEQLRNIPTHEKTNVTQSSESMTEMEYREKLKSLEAELQRAQALLISGGQQYDANIPICNNPNCRRKERELDIKTRELSHTEIENSTLKSKVQALNETTVFNEERMKRAFREMEEHIRKLEDERKDLVRAELTHRSSVSQIEEECKDVKEKLKQTQNELNVQKANYNQLKLLHEQTDRALSEAQTQIVRAETELVNYQSKAKDSSRDNVAQDREITKLSSDVQIMKNQLTKLDREKDELLNNLDVKTEKIALLEDQLNEKNKTIGKLESELKELKRKLSNYVDETSNQDHLVRSARQELNTLEKDYEKERRLREAAIQENKRLQSDLTTISCDCRDARTELEISRRQVEDLKRQLQHYVAEVKRTEDLISNKELERAELLDQFRCLSQEANILENSNHTLENEASQTRVQLSVALDHTSELERKIENQESIIRSYEKQISELTSQVASLELQLKQNGREHDQYSTEMRQMRDLCVKLDKEKDSLKHELYSKDDWRNKVDKVTEKLESEKQALQKALEKERTSLDSVEKLLNEARQEIIEQRLLNQDMQAEVDRLKQKIAELQSKLTTTSEQLDIYQVKALEYSQQNKHLRREIANERFSKAKSDDKGYYPSL